MTKKTRRKIQVGNFLWETTWTDTFWPTLSILMIRSPPHISHIQVCVVWLSFSYCRKRFKPSPIDPRGLYTSWNQSCLRNLCGSATINAKVPKTLPMDPPAGLQWWFLRVGEHTCSTQYQPGKSTAKDCTKELYLRRADSDSVSLFPIQKGCHALIRIIHMSIACLPKDYTFSTHHLP